MSDLERRVREAFDEVELPSETRTRTLAAIDALSVQEKESGTAAVRKTIESAEREAAEPAMRSDAAAAASRAPRLVAWRRAAAALAACLVLAVIGLTGSRLYFEETAFVDIDVNPSIELGINRFDIVVSARAVAASGGEGPRVRIGVSDEGPGISAEERTHLFDLFYNGSTGKRGDKSGDFKRGLGLGLPLCHSIVDVHGGVLEVRNVEPHGSEFWFMLPAVQADDVIAERMNESEASTTEERHG